jgi:GMP synthase (glutamine-hydrolysing)
MRNAIVITHVDFENLGSLKPALEQADYAIEVVNACVTDLRTIDSKSDLLIVLGGPVGVYEQDAYPFLKAEIDLIRLRLAGKWPTLGICLGAQLIAAAAGASVHPGTQGKEIGWAPLHAGRDAALCPEFAPLLADDLHVLHWHGDTFNLPSGARHLAATSAYQNQAFAIGRHALGLQFHPEVIGAELERWYVGHACELANAGISVPELRQQSRVFAAPLEVAAERFWEHWLSPF